MANEWYYRQEGSEEGPFSPSELRSKASAGEITTSASIRRGADGTWIPATQVQGLFGVPRVAAQPVASSTQLPPQVVATCWYCGNLRRTAEPCCGTCGASWSSEQPAAVAEQRQATQGSDARAVVGLIFLILVGCVMAQQGFTSGRSLALGAGGLALAATALVTLLLPWLVRRQQGQPGKQKIPTKGGSPEVPQAAGTSQSAVAATAESLRRGVGLFGYIALWVTVAVAVAGVVIVVAAVVALFVVCLGAAAGH